MARMLGKAQTDWCPYCRGPSGDDCPSTAIDKKTARRREKRQWRRLIDQ